MGVRSAQTKDHCGSESSERLNIGSMTVHAMYGEFTAIGDGVEKEKGGEDCRGCKQSYILSW